MAGFKSTRSKAPAPIDPWKGGAESIDKALQAVTSVLNSHDDELKKLNGGVTLGQNTVGLLKTLSFKMPDDPPWKALDAATNWGPASPEAANYLMEPGGLVRLRGGFVPGGGVPSIAPSGGGGGTSVLATIPAGYRPIQSTILPAYALDPTLWWALIGLSTSGSLYFAASGTAAAVAVGLDGMQWYATAAAPPHQFDETNWPLRVKHGFETKCTGLVVLGYRLQGQTGQNVGGGTPHVDWQDLGDGTLRINGVWGLQWGSRYDLALYLTPEKEEE